MHEPPIESLSNYNLQFLSSSSNIPTLSTHPGGCLDGVGMFSERGVDTHLHEFHHSKFEVNFTIESDKRLHELHHTESEVNFTNECEKYLVKVYKRLFLPSTPLSLLPSLPRPYPTHHIVESTFSSC